MAGETDDVPMSTVSIRNPMATKVRIERLAQATQRSPDFLASEAVESYLTLQPQQIAHIEDGLADLDAGRVHTHEEIENLVREFDRLADEEASR
jgi:RHH-type transcriptional regulator, rel operon repressor / antitoxin RelB